MKSLLLSIFTLLFINYANSQQLIGDNNFQMGFGVLDQNAIINDTIYASMGNDPAWSLAEWHSTSTVSNITPNVLSSGFYQWADNNKDFRFGPDGAEDYDLYFAGNSQNEYGNVYRQLGEEWPHLLIEQRLSAPFNYSNHGPECPSMDVLTALDFSIDAKLLYNQTIVHTGYDQTLHAAQFLIYFTVQNLNPSSAGYGKYVWLGIPVYDDRYPAIAGGGVQYDAGTQTLINTIPYDSCASETMHNGNWVEFRVDILPYALQALQAAWDNNYLTESSDLADYKIGGMNMGWEFPGMNISTVVTRNISLEATANQAYYLTENDTVCNGESYIFPDDSVVNNITTQIIYTSEFQTVAGLDSFITTTVDVNIIDTSLTVDNENIMANSTGLLYQWLDCDNNYSIIIGETGESFTASQNGYYAVEITDGNCVDTSECINISVLEIKSKIENGITVFPNPANNSVQVNCINDKINNISVYNLTGKTIDEIQSLNNKIVNIDISEFINGLYFIKIETDKTTIIRKIVKE